MPSHLIFTKNQQVNFDSIRTFSATPTRPHTHTPTYICMYRYEYTCQIRNGTKPMSTAISTINQAINLRSPTHFLIPIRLSCILLIYDHALVHLHRKTEKCSMQRRVVGETVVFFFHDKSHSSLSHFPSQRAPSNRRMLTSWWHPAWVMLCMNGAEPR